MLGVIWLAHRLFNRYLKRLYRRYITSSDESSHNTPVKVPCTNGSASCSNTADESFMNPPELVPDELEADFESASNHIRTVSGELPTDALLYLYSRYKQATVGDCNDEKPGILDQTNRRKWNAWHDLYGYGREQCMEEYVEKVVALACGWTRGTKVQAKAGLGMRPSRMVMTDEQQDDADNEGDSEWFTAIKTGDTVAIKRLMVTHDIDQVDENGMTALHWACDRGILTIVSMLLQHGAQLDITDENGQTALHYAASCDYVDVCELLLAAGADKSLVDEEGQTPVEYSSDQQLIDLLSD